MATPPPLHGNQGSTPSVRPPQPPRPPKKNSAKTWLIVGSGIALIAAIVAVLLYIFSDLKSENYEYDDGNRHEKPLRQRDDENLGDEMAVLTSDFETPEEEEEEVVFEEEVFMPTQGSCALHGIGVNTNSAISMDIDIDDNGNVTGTYWNILYHLKFKVSGVVNGTTNVDHLDLNLSIDGVTTPLYLSTTDGVNYSGTWGAKNKPVNITLHKGHFVADASPGATVSEGHISGNGLNRDFRISYGPGGDMYYWYPSQNFNNRLRIVDHGDGSYTLFRRDGGYQASITLNSSGSGTLQDTSNRTFTVKMK